VSAQTERDVPLAPHAFHVLLALEREPLHGYAIMKQVRETADGSVGPGAVYGALQRLEAAGLVREGRRLEPDRGSRPRQEYEITRAGLAALRAEALRLARLVRLAAERDLVPEEGPS
jgi:DNA-binding PadR family transcriptional regulator